MNEKLSIRKRIFEIIELSKDEDKISLIYDWFMMVVIVISIFPLTVKKQGVIAGGIDYITAVIFVIDYVLRLITADFKLNKKMLSFIEYPFTPMAIVDLVSILPSISQLANGFRLFKVFRLLRTFRVFKLLRYSKSVARIMVVFRKQKDSLVAVCILAVAYVLIASLVIFNVEPETFHTFFDAIYWAVVSLTTVGYGDVYPVSVTGRIVAMISSLFGIAIIALPSGIITAGYMEELKKENDDSETVAETTDKE